MKYTVTFRFNRGPPGTLEERVHKMPFVPRIEDLILIDEHPYIVMRVTYRPEYPSAVYVSLRY